MVDEHTPDLRGAVGSPDQFWSLAIEACPAATVVIGHSGAGAFLPMITDRVGAAVTVFVDAVLPGPDTTFEPSGRFAAFLAGVPTVGGLLAPWPEWWPAEKLAQLAPDERVRRDIVAETPSVPRSFYDEPVPVPSAWWTRPAGYLQTESGLRR